MAELRRYDTIKQRLEDRPGFWLRQKERAKLIGRIIFADLLELSLTKYKDFIDTTGGFLPLLQPSKSRSARKRDERKGAPLPFNKLLIKQKKLSKATVAAGFSLRPGVIAEIAKSSRGFSIRYTYEGFNIRYGEKFLECINYFDATEEASRFFHKLRRINSRNLLTHKILKGIIEHQREYLMTGDPADLVALSQGGLAGWIGACGHWSRIDKSWVSRLVNPVRSRTSNGVKGISVITPSGEEKPLKWFFQTQKDVNKRFVKRFLDKENKDIECGGLKKPLTDSQISAKLKRKYGLSLSRWAVGHCRKDMGIPPANRRLSGYKYPPLSANFSVLYPLTIEAVRSNAPASPGVYEFRLNGKEVEYPKGKTNVIYIGRTTNIKKRLKEHLGRQSKNHYVRDFLKKDKCLFRYILFKRDWEEEEKRLYRLFLSTFGASPKCNKVSP